MTLTIARHHQRVPAQTIVVNAAGDTIPAPFPVYPDDQFKARARPRHACQIVIHESVTHDPLVLDPGDKPDATERVLNRRGLGVHFMIGVDSDGTGVVVQHNPINDAVAHIGALNPASIGIEVVSPYYPLSNGKAPAPWSDVIDAPWAHKGRYVLPLPEQCEQLFQLIETICEWFPMMRPVPALDTTTNTYRLTQVHRTWSGGWTAAHAHIGGHADGAWPLLYVVLRRRGHSPAAAYEIAATLATGAHDVVRLPQ